MKSLPFLLILLILCGCAAPAPEFRPAPPPETAAPTAEATLPADPVEALLSTMTREEKVGQLFLARCDQDTALEDIPKYHLGGFVLFAVDFEGQTPDSLRQKLAAYQAAADIPLLIAVDEEGGEVVRISKHPAFADSPLPSARTAFDLGGIDGALQNEEAKCALLSGLNINVNLGPLCDIATDPDTFMYRRSLGRSPQDTGNYVFRTVRLMGRQGIGSVLKHFPGYGGNADTHTGMAVDRRSLAYLEENDLIPFHSGIQAGCGAVMVSHTIVEAFDAEYPASLSPAVHAYLRQTMEFEGVILTDDLYMQAISDAYGAGEAAVLAVLAGNDLLCVTEHALQYEAVLAAVESGRIPQETLDTAVARVLRWKADLGLI